MSLSKTDTGIGIGLFFAALATALSFGRKSKVFDLSTEEGASDLARVLKEWQDDKGFDPGERITAKEVLVTSMGGYRGYPVAGTKLGGVRQSAIPLHLLRHLRPYLEKRGYDSAWVDDSPYQSFATFEPGQEIDLITPAVQGKK
jgi:hypothetical protein